MGKITRPRQIKSFEWRICVSGISKRGLAGHEFEYGNKIMISGSDLPLDPKEARIQIRAILHEIIGISELNMIHTIQKVLTGKDELADLITKMNAEVKTIKRGIIKPNKAVQKRKYRV